MSLEKNLKKILKERNLNASSVSSVTDVPRSNIERWLSGGNPDLNQLLIVAKFLGLSIDELITGKRPGNSFDDLIEKFEVHSGMYEISVKKINKK